MRTQKWLIYHKKLQWFLYDLYSIIDDDELFYIVTLDGKEIRRYSYLITEEEFKKVI